VGQAGLLKEGTEIFERAMIYKHKSKMFQRLRHKRETESRYKKNGLVLECRPEERTNESVVTGTLQIK
jgi:hypothetical protein